MRSALALGLVALLGCEDKRAAAGADCDDTSDCPGGLACLDGQCQVPQGCETTAECCPGAECVGGQCVAAAPVCEANLDCHDPALHCVERLCHRQGCAATPDCPEGALCVAGFCHRDPPCGGRCVAGEVCYPHLDACRVAPIGEGNCQADCEPGFAPVVLAPEAYTGPTCEAGGARCECIRVPALQPADFGRHASMAVLSGEAIFAAYDADYGDLVFVEGVEAGVPRVHTLDGVPEGAPVVADPSGPRGGRTEAGPDRGRYASMAVDPKGQPHIAYYDTDAGALRYLRGDGEGGWTQPVVVDEAGDAGRYAQIAIDTQGRPHLAWYSHGAEETALRYAFSEETEPGPGDFQISTVSSRPALSAIEAPGITPRGHGVAPCMSVERDGKVYLGFYDGEAQRPFVARGDLTGFEVHPVSGALAESWPPDPGGRYERFEEHDLGRFCDLVAEPLDATIRLALLDADTNALLLYNGPVEGGGVFEMIDQGGRGIRRLVGADPALDRDADRRLVAVYQDATENDVLLSVRSAEGWSQEPMVVASAGALGFYNSLVMVDGEAVIGTLELKTLAAGRGAHRLHVFRVEVPRF